MGKIMIGRKIDGKPNRISVYGKTKGEVLNKLRDLSHSVQYGTYIEPSKVTFGEWLIKWLKDYKSIKLKPRTYDTYETQINYHIVPKLGFILLKDLKTYHIQNFYQGKFDNGKGLSSATIRKMHNIIKSSLVKAIDSELINKNPCKGIDLPPLEQKNIKAFTSEEQINFFETSNNYDLNNAFILAVDTGLRMGEIIPLTWKDIDLKEGYVSVTKNVMYVKDRENITGNKNMLIIQDTPKTKSSIRKVPLTQRVLKMLKEIKLEKSLNSNLLFASRKNTYINPRNFERAFQDCIKRAGIEKCNSHTLRHTFATRCFECGVPAKIVSKWLGHSKVSHTLDIYTHVLPDLDKSAIKAIEKPLITGICEDNAQPNSQPNCNPIPMIFDETR